MSKTSIFVYSSIFCIVGVLLGILEIQFFGLLCLPLIFIRRIQKIVIVVILAAFIFGLTVAALEAHGAEKKQRAMMLWQDQKTVIRGEIVSDTVSRKNSFGVAQTQAILKPASGYGKLRITVKGERYLSYGDDVVLVGKIKEPQSFSGFNYPMFLVSQGIFGVLENAEVYVIERDQGSWFISQALGVKHWLYAQFHENLPKDHAALIIALLAGDKNFLTKSWQEKFSETGTAHMIAVSGFVLTLIMLGIFGLRNYLGLYISLLLMSVCAFVYIVMAGFAPGVLRAAIMAYIYVGAKFFEKEYDLLPILIFTGLIIVLMSPYVLLYDLGFLFSFGSLFGIYFFAPYIKQVLFFVPSKYGIQEIVASTIAAQAATAPLTAYYFQQFSIIAPLANVLILPLVPFLLMIGYLGAVPYVGQYVGYSLWVPLEYILRIVDLLSSIPYSSITINIGRKWLFAVYVIEIATLVILKKKPKFAKVKPPN
jgi:competence protein ComEC